MLRFESTVRNNPPLPPAFFLLQHLDLRRRGGVGDCYAYKRTPTPPPFHTSNLSAKACHVAKRRVGYCTRRRVLESVRAEAVLPDRALCLTNFCHFFIVNISSLSPPTQTKTWVSPPRSKRRS